MPARSTSIESVSCVNVEQFSQNKNKIIDISITFSFISAVRLLQMRSFFIFSPFFMTSKILFLSSTTIVNSHRRLMVGIQFISIGNSFFFGHAKTAIAYDRVEWIKQQKKGIFWGETE